MINLLGLEDVHQKLSEKYEKMRLRKRFKDDSDDEDEQVLFATKIQGPLQQIQ